MRTAGFCPPLRLTRPTPGSCEIFCARRVSARSCTLVSGSTSEVSARVSTGASAGVVLLLIGGGGGGGRGGGGAPAVRGRAPPPPARQGHSRAGPAGGAALSE